MKEIDADNQKQLSRKQLSVRWGCSTRTLRRMEGRGILNPIFISSRIVRYRVSAILAFEKQAEVNRQSL